jgi:hypothetical protein
MSYQLDYILNAFVSKDQVKDLSRKMSLPVSGVKGDLIDTICHRGRSARNDKDKAAFKNLVRSALDS